MSSKRSKLDRNECGDEEREKDPIKDGSPSSAGIEDREKQPRYRDRIYEEMRRIDEEEAFSWVSGLRVGKEESGQSREEA